MDRPELLMEVDFLDLGRWQRVQDALDARDEADREKILARMDADAEAIRARNDAEISGIRMDRRIRVSERQAHERERREEQRYEDKVQLLTGHAERTLDLQEQQIQVAIENRSTEAEANRKHELAMARTSRKGCLLYTSDAADE